MRRIDLTGKQFGRLTVLSISGRSANGIITWRCRCDCGELTDIQSYLLRRGTTKSCGCLRVEVHQQRLTIHGNSHNHLSSEYICWQGVKARCLNSNNPNYPRYGGRGITVCARWKNSFKNFLADMGRKPSIGHSIDRINNDGNYEPSNCRWATRSEQKKNSRNGVLLTFNGLTQNLIDWATYTGLNRVTISRRIREQGLSVEDALTKPGRRLYGA